MTYHTPPEEGGQIVTSSWACAGEAGAIERIHDSSDGTTTYWLHHWLANDAAFDPWNGSPVDVSVTTRSRRITDEEARRYQEETK